MKRYLTLLAAAVMVMAGCQKYDDTALKQDITSLQGRVDKIEAELAKIQSNITSIQSIIAGLQGQVADMDYVKEVQEVKDANGVVIGYKFVYSNSESKTFYLTDTGCVGIVQLDGGYYWSVGGQPVVDANGNKVPVSVAPKVAVNNGKLQVSYDGGKTWNDLMDKIDVQIGEETVTITVGGTSVTIDLVPAFSLKVETTQIKVSPEQEGIDQTIPYTVKGAAETDEVVVLCTYAPAGFNVTVDDKEIKVEAVVKKGTIVVTAVNNTTGVTSSQAITFAEGVLEAAIEAYVFEAEGGVATVTLTYNVAYTVTTSDEWISAEETKATETVDLKFNVAANTGVARIGSVTFTGSDGSVATVVIAQKANTTDNKVSPMWAFQPTTKDDHHMTADAHWTMAVVGDYLILSNSKDFTKMPVYNRWTGEYLGDNFINTTGLDATREIRAITTDDAEHLIAVTYTVNPQTEGTNGTVRGWVWKNGIDKAPVSTWWAGLFNYGTGAAYAFTNIKAAGDVTTDAIVATSASSGAAIFDVFTDGKLTSSRLKKSMYGGSAWNSSNICPMNGTAKTVDDIQYVACSGQFRQYLNYNGTVLFNNPASFYTGNNEYQRNAIGGDYIQVGSHRLYGVLQGWYAGSAYSTGAFKFYYQLAVSDLGEGTIGADSFKDGLMFSTRYDAEKTGMGYGVQGMFSPFAYDGSSIIGENEQVGDVVFATSSDGSVQVYALVMNLGIIAYNITF